MKRSLALAIIVLVTHVQAAPTFVLSIHKTQWKKWGFEYPVTYVFRITGLEPDAQVRRRDGQSATWSPLPKATGHRFYNGIECVRFDADYSRAYVSVGFRDSNSIELEFTGVADARFAGVARYYDNRDAAFTLSNDNWGFRASAHPGAAWKGMTDDESDNYQAALCACRSLHLPVSIAINSGSAGGEAMWRTMQQELNRRDFSWEPAVHARTHPAKAADYAIHGYPAEILGCRDEILAHLQKIPFGQHVFEHILTTGYVDDQILRCDAAQFLFVRGYNGHDNPASVAYVAWNREYGYYGVGGLSTIDYDRVIARTNPAGRFNAANVAELNRGFDAVLKMGGIFYALWHPDRYRNSVLYDPAPGLDGQRGSTLMRHLAYVANRKNVWYVANGWMYSYRFVAENVRVTAGK